MIFTWEQLGQDPGWQDSVWGTPTGWGRAAEGWKRIVMVRGWSGSGVGLVRLTKETMTSWVKTWEESDGESMMPQKVPLADLNLTMRIVMILRRRRSRTKEMMLKIKFLPFVKGRSDPERGRSTCESAWTPLSWVIIRMRVARLGITLNNDNDCWWRKKKWFHFSTFSRAALIEATVSQSRT